MGDSNRNEILYSLYKRSRILPTLYWACRERWGKYVSRRRGLAFDRLHDVETEEGFGPLNLGLPSELAAHSSAYNPIDPVIFARVMDLLKIDPKGFCFIDIGSGKGRALFLAEQHGFRRILGIEFSAKVHRVAVENLRRYRARVSRDPRTELLDCDALALNYPTEPTVLFMFNPFDAVIMARFVAKMESSLAQHPRDFYLIYVHPYAEPSLAGSKLLKKMSEERRKYNFVVYQCLDSSL
jgi:SAM-dependent methyltransferase